MGMLWGAQVQTMMPKLHCTNFPGMELIRPLYLIREDDIKAWRDYNGLHFIQCACKFTDSCTTCRGEGNRGDPLQARRGQGADPHDEKDQPGRGGSTSSAASKTSASTP